MKNLSIWAKQNVWQTWVIISVCHYLLYLGTMFLAKVAYLEGLSLSMPYLFATLTIFILSMALYPIKGFTSGLFKNSYERRVKSGRIILWSGIALIFVFSNILTAETEQYAPAKFQDSHVQEVLLKQNPNEVVTPTFWNKRREAMKKISYKKTQKIKKLWNKLGSTDSALLIALVVALTLLIGSLVAYWACTLSCNGAGAMATAVLILGWGVLIVGVILFIRYIINKEKAAG